jgi:hypothetical protein
MNTKVVNYSTNHLLAPFYLVCVVLVGFGLVSLLQHIAALETDGVLSKVVEYGALDRYFAEFLAPLGRFRLLAWLVNYAPLALLCGALVVLSGIKIYKLFRPEAEKILLSSNEFDLIHRGVDMPPINHLENILLLCPNPDAASLKEDLYLAGTHPEAPPSSASDVEDAPLTGLGDPSRNKTSP